AGAGAPGGAITGGWPLFAPPAREGSPRVHPLRVLFLSAEVALSAKAGGLADVCGPLPKALAALGHDVRVVMPAYQSVEADRHAGRNGVHPHPVTLRVPLGHGILPAGVLQATLPGSAVPV